jgi:hypothetical protein
MRTPTFAAELKRLRRWASKAPTAIICAEA